MGMASDIGDLDNWTKRLYGWRFVVARYETGRTAIEFRMERCGIHFVVEERTDTNEDGVWYIGHQGAVRTSPSVRPPQFPTRLAAAAAASTYHRLQYGEDKCPTKSHRTK